MHVLEILVLVLIGEAALPFSTIFLFLLLQDLDLDARQSDFYGARVSPNDLLYCNTIVDLLEELDVLIHVDMNGPAVSDSKEHLLEHSEVHCALAAGIMDPFLCHLTVHLFLTV